MPEWHAKLLEIGVGQLGQDLRVDFVFAEGDFVLARPRLRSQSPTSMIASTQRRRTIANAQGLVKRRQRVGERAGRRLLARRRRERGPVAVSANLATRQARAFLFAASRLSDLQTR